jgi:hypothetical protein
MRDRQPLNLGRHFGIVVQDSEIINEQPQRGHIVRNGPHEVRIGFAQPRYEMRTGENQRAKIPGRRTGYPRCIGI